MHELDPYAPPAADLTPPKPVGTYHAEVDTLFCTGGAVLPQRCSKTNRPVTNYQMTTLTFTYNGSTPFSQNTVQLTFGISAEEERRRMLLQTAFWLLMIGSLLASTAFFYYGSPIGGIVCLGGMVWSFYLAHLGTFLFKIIKVTAAGEFVFRGFGPEFLASIRRASTSQP